MAEQDKTKNEQPRAQKADITESVSFIELVKEARDIEQKPQRAQPSQTTFLTEGGRFVSVSVPEYAEMSYQEISSELKKIEKIRATLDYTTSQPQIISQGAPAQKPTLVLAKPQDFPKTSTEVKRETQVQKPVEKPYSPPKTQQETKPASRSPIIIAQQPVKEEAQRPTEKELQAPEKKPEKKSLAPDFDLKEIAASKPQVALPEPEKKRDKTALQMLIAQEMEAPEQEKKKSPAQSIQILNEPEKFAWPLPPVETKKTPPVEKPKEKEPISEKKPEPQQKKMQGKFQEPSQTAEPQKQIQQEPKKEGGLFSGLTGVLGSFGKSQEKTPGPEILEPQRQRGPEPAKGKTAPQTSIQMPAVPEPQETLKQVQRETITSEELAQAWKAAIEAKREQPIKKKEEENPKSIPERIETTKKKIGSAEAAVGAEKGAADVEQLERLGKYWKEHEEKKPEVDPLAKLREYRRKRQEEWDKK